MNYQQTLDYLYTQLPMFQRVGEQAFKKDLTNIRKLAAHLGNPHQSIQTVHIAGTNGKGSTTHILAAFLQTAGYKVGVYSSPHYRDFRERIKINGQYIPEQAVVDFVAKNKDYIEELQPSFFEITVGMAFQYFATQKVDIAVIETGLGGRLDSTNIITPLLSIITNIGMDHEAMLGNTLEAIAGEKAGIIKENVPVVIGESQPETEGVFRKIALEKKAPIVFADTQLSIELEDSDFETATYSTKSELYPALNFSLLDTDLVGNYQHLNLRNALFAVPYLQSKGFDIQPKHIRAACLNIKGISKLIGRWQILAKNPLTICDSAHNADGITYATAALQQLDIKQLHFVYGTVNDKDLDKILPLLPKEAIYYFCKADIPRGLDTQVLANKAKDHQLKGNSYPSVSAALMAANLQAEEQDCIFVGGSIFVVAEVV